MAVFNIFKRKNNQVANIDSLNFADSDISAAISNATIPTDTIQGGVVYNNPIDPASVPAEKTFELHEVYNDSGLWVMDIAQSHHFTVWLASMNGMSALQVPTSPLTKDLGFLPVKTMNLKYTSYENMSIPVAIFGDFPLLNKKRVSTIDLSCYDYDNNQLEYELRKWEAQCFPKGRYVAYMDTIARELRYRGYSVDGRLTLEYRVFVIPAGNLSVSRDYSANDAKMVNFSLVVVGDGRTCAEGNGRTPHKQKMSDSSGLGGSSYLNGNGKGNGNIKATIWYNHQV